MMRAGTLRERIVIQKPTKTANSVWGPQTAYVDAFAIGACVIVEHSSEKVTDKAVRAARQYLITVRFRKDIDTTNRIIWRGKSLDITSCLDTNGSRRELEITAVEHVSNG